MAICKSVGERRRGGSGEGRDRQQGDSQKDDLGIGDRIAVELFHQILPSQDRTAAALQAPQDEELRAIAQDPVDQQLKIV